MENWKPIPGYEGAYEVSNLGRVRSLDRVQPSGRGWMRRHRGRLLKLVPQHAYYVVGIGGKPQRVHVLVAAAFIGPRPHGLEVCHGDGNPQNNRADNLRYGTASENQLDAVLHGANKKAAQTHCTRGHEYNEANTMVRRKPGRRPSRACRTCFNEQQRERRQLRKAAA